MFSVFAVLILIYLTFFALTFLIPTKSISKMSSKRQNKTPPTSTKSTPSSKETPLVENKVLPKVRRTKSVGIPPPYSYPSASQEGKLRIVWRNEERDPSLDNLTKVLGLKRRSRSPSPILSNFERQSTISGDFVPAAMDRRNSLPPPDNQDSNVDLSDKTRSSKSSDDLTKPVVLKSAVSKEKPKIPNDLKNVEIPSVKKLKSIYEDVSKQLEGSNAFKEWKRRPANQVLMKKIQSFDQDKDVNAKNSPKKEPTSAKAAEDLPKKTKNMKKWQSEKVLREGSPEIDNRQMFEKTISIPSNLHNIHVFPDVKSQLNAESIAKPDVTVSDNASEISNQVEHGVEMNEVKMKHEMTDNNFFENASLPTKSKQISDQAWNDNGIQTSSGKCYQGEKSVRKMKMFFEEKIMEVALSIHIKNTMALKGKHGSEAEIFTPSMNVTDKSATLNQPTENDTPKNSKNYEMMISKVEGDNKNLEDNTLSNGLKNNAYDEGLHAHTLQSQSDKKLDQNISTLTVVGLKMKTAYHNDSINNNVSLENTNGKTEELRSETDRSKLGEQENLENKSKSIDMNNENKIRKAQSDESGLETNLTIEETSQNLITSKIDIKPINDSAVNKSFERQSSVRLLTHKFQKNLDDHKENDKMHEESRKFKKIQDVNEMVSHDVEGKYDAAEKTDIGQPTLSPNVVSETSNSLLDGKEKDLYHSKFIVLSSDTEDEDHAEKSTSPTKVDDDNDEENKKFGTFDKVDESEIKDTPVLIESHSEENDGHTDSQKGIDTGANMEKATDLEHKMLPMSGNENPADVSNNNIPAPDTEELSQIKKMHGEHLEKLKMTSPSAENNQNGIQVPMNTPAVDINTSKFQLRRQTSLNASLRSIPGHTGKFRYLNDDERSMFDISSSAKDDFVANNRRHKIRSSTVSTSNLAGLSPVDRRNAEIKNLSHSYTSLNTSPRFNGNHDQPSETLPKNERLSKQYRSLHADEIKFFNTTNKKKSRRSLSDLGFREEVK